MSRFLEFLLHSNMTNYYKKYYADEDELKKEVGGAEYISHHVTPDEGNSDIYQKKTQKQLYSEQVLSQIHNMEMFTVEPVANTMEYLGIFVVCTQLTTFFAVLALVAIIACTLLIPMEANDDVFAFVGMFAMMHLSMAASIILKILQLHFMYTKQKYYYSYVVVQRYGHNPRTYLYTDIANELQHRRAKKRGKNFFIPVPGGWLKVPASKKYNKAERIVRFLNKREGIQIATDDIRQVTKSESAASKLFSISNKIAIFCFFVDLLFSVVIFVADQTEPTFLQYYFPTTLKEMFKRHFFMGLAVIMYIFVIYIAMDDWFFGILRRIGVIKWYSKKE